jgi:hypothetical protein
MLLEPDRIGLVPIVRQQGDAAMGKGCVPWLPGGSAALL